jgi:hypothetical protein
MTIWTTRDCECKVTTGTGQKRPEYCGEHGNRFLTKAQLVASQKPRKPLRSISDKRAAKEEAGTRPPSRGSTLNRGRGMAAAPAQQRKVRGLACVGCGRIIEPDSATGGWVIDAAHVLSRAAGGCADPLCTIPLCRNEYTQQGCHPDYDAERLDIHGKLVDRGYFKEMAHVIEAHAVSPLTLVNRLTGEEHKPESVFVAEMEALKARVVQLEGAIAA